MGTLRLMITVLLIAFTFGVGIVSGIGPLTTACLKKEFEDAKITGYNGVRGTEEVDSIDYLRVEYGKGKTKIHIGSQIGIFPIDTTSKPILTWKTLKTAAQVDPDTNYLLLMVSLKEHVRFENDDKTAVFHWVVKNLKFADLTSKKNKRFGISNTKGKPTEVVKYVKPGKSREDGKTTKYLFLVYQQPMLEPGEPSDPDPFHPGSEPITLKDYFKNNLKLGDKAPVVVAGNFFKQSS